MCNPLLYLLRTWKCFFLSTMVSNARNDSSECVNVRLLTADVNLNCRCLLLDSDVRHQLWIQMLPSTGNQES
jgi:hypothetical protein